MDAHRISSLTEQHAASLALFARQWCDQPEDAVQNAFVDLLRLEQDPDDPAAWLFATVRRRAINIARTERRLAERERTVRTERKPWFSSDVDRQLMAGEIERSIGTLDDLERQIVVAHIWGELSFSQIAKVVDKPSSTVHRHYKNALATLAKSLNEEPRRLK